jgi:ferredoxin
MQLQSPPARHLLRPSLTTIIPDKMRKRPLDARGYPVPWFVQWIDNKPDFRVMDMRKYSLALDKRRCWLCGANLGKCATFVAGLMSIVSRTSSEPPSHMECAKFAVRGCPFLTIPTAQYREANLPPGSYPTPGLLMDNPEVSALWTCDSWTVETIMGDDGQTARVVHFGDAKSVSYWKQGRAATDTEVMETFWRRLTILQRQAEQDGGSAPVRLAQRVDAALFWLPDAA